MHFAHIPSQSGFPFDFAYGVFDTPLFGGHSYVAVSTQKLVTSLCTLKARLISSVCHHLHFLLTPFWILLFHL